MTWPGSCTLCDVELGPQLPELLGEFGAQISAYPGDEFTDCLDGSVELGAAWLPRAQDLPLAFPAVHELLLAFALKGFGLRAPGDEPVTRQQREVAATLRRSWFWQVTAFGARGRIERPIANCGAEPYPAAGVCGIG
jgi:hypothetical protein